jgi:hypothetical protein
MMIEEGVRNRTQARTRASLGRLFVACAALSFAFFSPPAACGQAVEGQPARTSQGGAGGARTHLIGAVTSVDAATGQLTVRTDAGSVVTVSTNDRTSYLRLPPGETRMDAATSITRADVRVGDRVLVPGGASADAQAAPARQVIVTSAAAGVVGGSGRGGEDMRARRVVGRVTRVDPARREIVVQSRTREGSEDVTITAAGDARFMRFAPDSIRPADARQSTLGELRVGDQLRATGERSGDGTRFAAQEIISGTFARVAGQVASVDAGRGEVTVKSEQTGETFTVNVGRNSVLKRVSAEASEAFEQRRGARREERRAEREAAGGTSEGAQRGERRRERGARGEGRGGERPRGGGGGGNLLQLLESLPAVTVAELKKGDAVLVTGSTGADASRVTALMLVTGDADFLRRLQRRVGDDLRNMSPGLPGTVLGGGTGGGGSDPQP